ncbi:hypothetical protein P4O66_003291 [Electrophorus voltai]|uniref:Solute carrier organic anion transporter family member 3A1 n=1 Tax=Electrophorus voltai TaxID=2609070 RepID=A0AAD8YNX7_9TELE|nr:hypothetical protein P4O66_003291 [Electrophorus voltai]
MKCADSGNSGLCGNNVLGCQPNCHNSLQGILFSTLVFGPACGFILGSVCTKFYVDAVFIDTSKFQISLLLCLLPANNLTKCMCVSGDGDFGTAVPGKCPSPGCQEAFLTFLCVICACSMIGAMAQTPSVIILIRTVSSELKSYALGVLFLSLRLLGFIPPPLIFGAGIDSTCLFWSTECGARGACVLYDNVAYRHLYVSLAIVLKVIAFLLYTTTWQCLRRNYKKYIKNNETYVTSTEIFSSDVNLDSLGKGAGQNPVNRTKFIYSLEDHEWCENMESVL